MLTSKNTEKSERAVMAAAIREFHFGTVNHHHLQTDFEHGQWWVTCRDCGAQWSAHDTDTGVGFERVTQGDGYCSDSE